MAGKVVWNQAEADRRVQAWAVKALNAAAIIVENHAKVLVSVAGTGTGRGAGGRFRRIYGSNPSRPGEPPHKQEGHLRRSITHEVDPVALVARVGTNVKYGRYLELGTRRMRPRPWLRRSFAETATRVRRILARPV